MGGPVVGVKRRFSVARGCSARLAWHFRAGVGAKVAGELGNQDYGDRARGRHDGQDQRHHLRLNRSERDELHGTTVASHLKALADPAIADKLTAAGLVPNGGSPEAMTNTVKQDVARFGALVQSIGIKPE